MYYVQVPSDSITGRNPPGNGVDMNGTDEGDIPFPSIVYVIVRYSSSGNMSFLAKRICDAFG